MFSYLPVEGVTAALLEDFEPDAPAGLEGLYALFADARKDATVCLFRMPNGRALLSVSCVEVGDELTTDVLWLNRESIATGLQRSMEDHIATEPEFRKEELCGFEALTADIPLRMEDGTTLTTRAWLFCRGGDLMELWAAHPSQLTYVFDQAADKELKSDCAALEEVLQGLNFEVSTEEESEPLTLEEPETQLPHMTITADNGMFRMDAPLDAMVIHSGTDAATVARARTLFGERTGGGECFDLWYQEVQELGCWLVVSREYGLAVQVLAAQGEPYNRLDLNTLKTMEAPILAAIREKYGAAEVADAAATVMLDGMEHVWFTYAIEHSGMELLTYVLSAADGTALYEMDIYLSTDTTKDSDELSQMILQMMDSLDYLPDMDV